MIEVKVIRKPKNEGSTSALNTSGTAYGGMAVKEAAHAAKADVAELAEEAIHSKDSDHALEADHSQKSDWAAEADEAKHAQEADHASDADNADKWDGRQFDDYLDQPVRKTDGVTFDSVAADSVCCAGGFVNGLLGAGFGLWMDGNGQSRLEVDKLLVRMKAEFESLTIRKVEHIGGEIVLSLASMKVAKVETIPSGKLHFSDGNEVLFPDGTEAMVPGVYRCYFLSDDGDTAIANDFQVGDLATCRTWNIKPGIHEGASNRYYWRAVVGVGDDYIDLSSVDCDAASDVPMAGDEIVQLGNKYDADRQSAIVLSTYGGDSPSIKLYRGVDGYSMGGKEFADMSRKRINLKVDNISMKGKSGEYISIGDELETRPTRDELLKTGINIRKNTVTVTAESFLVRTLGGGAIAAFTYKNGKPVLRAGMVDVDSLFAGTINANDAIITNFKFANAQSLDGSFSVDGNGNVNLGEFTIKGGALDATIGKSSLHMFSGGVKFETIEKKNSSGQEKEYQKLYAGIGSTISYVSGYTDMVAGYFKVGYDSLPLNSGAVMIKTTNLESVSGASKTFPRQIALRIETEGGDYDYAIDAKGKIKTDGSTGLTGSFGVRDANDVLMWVDFVNGIYVGVRH